MCDTVGWEMFVVENFRRCMIEMYSWINFRISVLMHSVSHHFFHGFHAL